MIFCPRLKFSADLRVMGQHAWTVFVGQIAVMGFGVTDTIVAGRHAELSLAALSIGAAIFITVYVSLLGLIQALLPIWAELHGARQPEKIGPSVRQSLYICLLAALLGMWLLLHPMPLLEIMQIPPDLQPLARDYLFVLGWALPAALLFRVFSTLSQAINRPRVVTWLQLAGLLIKLPLSIWFVFGGLGLPSLGVAGCAWATWVVQFFWLACAVLLSWRQPVYRRLMLWRALEKPDWAQLLEFARLGVPTALTILVEITSFTWMALFIARLGITAAAAHQIASNVTGMLYMAPLSLGVAASARVSYWRGYGSPVRARHASLRALRMTLLLAVAASGLLLLLRTHIAAIYSPQPEVQALAARLLLALVVFHVFDAVQAVSIFVLRCYRVAFMPMLAYAVFLWGVGLMGGYTLAYRGLGPVQAMRSPLAFWLMSSLGVAIAAVLVCLLLLRVSRRACRAQAN